MKENHSNFGGMQFGRGGGKGGWDSVSESLPPRTRGSRKIEHGSTGFLKLVMWLVVGWATISILGAIVVDQ